MMVGLEEADEVEPILLQETGINLFFPPLPFSFKDEILRTTCIFGV